MKSSCFAAALLCAASAIPALAQSSTGLGEVVVTSNRLNARYAQQDRPVIGLRRQADSAVMQVSFSSDSRDEADRKREIHAMLLAAIEKAKAAGLDLVTGNFELVPVTAANYKEVPLFGAGRVDTSRALVMVKAKLTGSTTAAEQRIKAFVKALPKSGRGTIDEARALTLTIIDPDQYREAIVKLVAEDARHQAAIFGRRLCCAGDRSGRAGILVAGE